MPQLPEAFVQRMQQQLPDTYADFEAALAAPVPTSVRINRSKQPAAFAEAHFAGATPVPWCPDACYLPERPRFVEDPHIFAGSYYVQEASSMLLHQAIEQHLKPQESQPLRVLDLCAAPGGKSTLLAAALPADSLLLSNELVGKRVLPLVDNLTRWGLPNTWVSQQAPRYFTKPLANYFNCIVVDAPCSGEGMFRKDAGAVQQWSQKLVQQCANVQQEILSDILPCLRPGGLLVYSTCTFAPEEDEQQLQWLQEQGLINLPLQLPQEWNITPIEAGNAVGYRCIFHKTKGEGFFLSVFQKPADGLRGNLPSISKKHDKSSWLSRKSEPVVKPWLNKPEAFSYFTEGDQVVAIPKHLTDHYKLLYSLTRLRHAGVPLGQLSHNKLIPSHALAQSVEVSEQLPTRELNYAEAISYLRKEEVAASGSDAKGWLLASYQGQKLGWLKAVPGRLNNHYPKELRIRKSF